MKTIVFDNVYVYGKSSVAGPIEAQGPLKEGFDKTYIDLYCQKKSFEEAERAMIYDACDCLFKKANIKIEDIDLIMGGDLLNQLGSSHYFARDLPISFIGMYAACATSSLLIGEASMWIDTNKAQKVLLFTSSHNAAAERQFRYPNEYGIQKKASTTYTVTGAGAMILSNIQTNIQIKAYTIGHIIDWQFKDANDMGRAMAPVAYETIINHIQNRNLNIEDYDLIATGDLSKLGFAFLCDLFLENNIKIHNRLFDCGLMIYDTTKQKVFAGGSGCACSMCVSIASLLNKVANGEYKRILVVATGALLSPQILQQKESIPCIAHAIEYVWSDVSCNI